MTTALPARRPSAGAVPGRWGARLAVRTPPAASPARSVVEDGGPAAAVGDDRVRRPAQVREEDLVRLAEPVADDRHGEGLAGLAGGEGQRAGRGLIVAARGSGAIRRWVVVHRRVAQ